jgi:hypothetical protein
MLSFPAVEGPLRLLSGRKLTCGRLLTGEDDTLTKLGSQKAYEVAVGVNGRLVPFLASLCLTNGTLQALDQDGDSREDSRGTAGAELALGTGYGSAWTWVSLLSVRN